MGIRINHYIGDKDFTQLMVWLVGLGCLVVWIPVENFHPRLGFGWGKPPIGILAKHQTPQSNKPNH